MASREEGSGPQGDTASSVASGLRRGEPRAAEIVRERVGRIVSFRGYGIPSQDRMDLVQEVMAQLWQAVSNPGFDTGAGFWGFVETVSARRCIDWWRTQRQTVQLDAGLRDKRPGPLAEALVRERSQQVLEILNRMSEPCRELILMRFSRGKSYREISQSAGTSEGALRVRLHRCIGRFRELLEERTADQASSSSDSEARP